MRRRRRRKKKPSHPKTPCRSYSLAQPDDPSSSQPLPIYKKALKWIEKEKAISPKTVPPPPKLRSCLMFSSSSQSYQESFPPLEKQTDPQAKVVSQPFVQSPTVGVRVRGVVIPELQQSEIVLWTSSPQVRVSSRYTLIL